MKTLSHSTNKEY